jgi:hypothetical protein
MWSGRFSAGFPNERAARTLEAQRMDPIVLQATTLSVTHEGHSNLLQTCGDERRVVSVERIA